MASPKKDPVLVVFQLSGGNDYMNTVIKHNEPLYRDNRPLVNIPDEDIIRIDDEIGFHPSMAPIKNLWDQGQVSIIHGVGYSNGIRSHFRSMDIWHTCEPVKLGTEGWLGKAIKELDPNKDNVVSCVSFGPSLFRALTSPGVPVACVDDLDNYGLLTAISEQQQREKILERFTRLYSPAIGSGPVMEYLGQTGLDALKGADILKAAPQMYGSEVEYPDTAVAKKLKGIAQIHFAGLGTRVFYLDHGSFDTHAGQLGPHANLWKDVSEGIGAFFEDLKDHNQADNVVMLIFTEFGRRVHDNGSGSDHGAGGVAFALGEPVKGGQYSEYPSMKNADLEQGDLVYNLDFRGVYRTLLEDWMGLDGQEIVGGAFEKPSFIA